MAYSFDEHSDWEHASRILREMRLQENNYPDEETELFDEVEEDVLRECKRLFLEHGYPDPGLQAQARSSAPAKQSVLAEKLASQKLDAIRPYLRQYMAADNESSKNSNSNNNSKVNKTNNSNSSSTTTTTSSSSSSTMAFEAFLARLLEMAYGVRQNLADDVRVALRYDQDTGWPAATVWTRQPRSAYAVDSLLGHTRDLVRGMAEAGAAELPHLFRVEWKLCASRSRSVAAAIDDHHDEVAWRWGDKSCHFGRLDLAACLGRFPRCDLNLGWLGLPAGSGGVDGDGDGGEICAEPWLIECRRRPRGALRVGGGGPSGPAADVGSPGPVSGRGRVAQACFGILSRVDGRGPRLRAAFSRRNRPAVVEKMLKCY